MNIVFEDSDIIVLDKPAGIVVHPDANHQGDTLVDELVKYCPTIKNAILDPDNQVSRERPGIVHRLDKDTSGLLVVAKNRDSLLKLQESIREGKMIKIYQALLFGRIDKEQSVESNIIRSKKSDRAMMVSYDQLGRKSISIFKPKRYYLFDKQDLTLCDVEIKTGRTHQIRVHALSIGHPVIGDPMYKTKPSRNLSQKLDINRQFLHSSFLSFPHPRTCKQMHFESHLHYDLVTLLSQMINFE